MRARGFTLLELLVVLAVMGVVAALVLPRFAGSLDHLQLQREARQVASLLRQTRGSAVAKRQMHALTFDFRRRQIGSSDPARTHRWADHITLSLEAATRAPAQARRIVFYADGSSSGGRLVLAASGRSYCVAVDWLTGMVTVDDS